MKRILFKKTEVIENEKVFELEISNENHKKLAGGKFSLLQVIAMYGQGDLIDKKTNHVSQKSDFHNWEDFQYEKKSINSWYELLPVLIKAKRFEVLFVKKDFTERKMNCEFESTNHIDKGILTVWDLEISGYRSINLETLKRVVIKDTIFTLKEGEVLYV